MTVTAYRVIAVPVVAEIEVKRSRFRCDLVRVEDEDAARAVVDAARRDHWDARHHCSALVLGPDGRVARSSDDGEPAGTAGAPMLEALRGAELSDVVAVVTRWFGGTLLGAGGLVRAYGDAVRAAVAEATVLERRLQRLWTVEVGHAEAGRLENELRARGVTVRDTQYAASARLTLAAPERLDLVPLLAALTSGETLPEPAGEAWVDTPAAT